MKQYDQDSMFRDKSFYKEVVLPVAIIMSITCGIVFGVVNPYFYQEAQKIKDKSQAELKSINNMNCQQLHDKLLSSDHFFDSDNEAITRDHYVANCGVRLP